MLPHINTKNGHLPSYNRVLVLGRNNAQALSILDQPSPATSLQTQQCLLESFLESLGATPRLGDLSAEGRRTVRLRVWGAGRAEVLPEEGVVDVTAAVELDGGLQGDLTGDVVG